MNEYFLDELHHQPHAFSVQGFKLVGKTLQSAAESKSMINLLRAYGSVQTPIPPITRNPNIGKEVTPLQNLRLLNQKKPDVMTFDER